MKRSVFRHVAFTSAESLLLIYALSFAAFVVFDTLKGVWPS